jgi:hypothetical protein
MGPRPEEITSPHEMDDTNDNRRINNDNATTSEDGPETTDTTDTADAWAVASGYTPLSDLNNNNDGGNAYMMVSAGPGNNSDSDSDGDDWNRGNITGPTGAFYVNPNVFGNSNDMDGTAVTAALNSSSVEEIDFDQIATSALSALDEEYQQTTGVMPPSDAVSAKEKQQEDEDLKIIAAGFDERREELERIHEEGGFVTQWEESDGKSSIGGVSEKDLKKDSDVDTNAVRKAMETLAVKNKDAPFQQKFAIWQQKQQPKRQQRQIVSSSQHTLIPTTSYEVFHEPTPTAESRLASANLSRSAILADAVVRLSLLSNFQDNDVLLIDIVGVDHVECNSASRIRNTFRPFVRWLDDYFRIVSSQKDHQTRIRSVHFRLIGRELATTSTTAEGVIVDLLLGDDSSSTATTPSSPSPLPPSSLRATATCHSGVYHEFWEEQIRHTGTKSRSNEHGGKTIPDLAVAFNAGIWGYREWADTIQYLALQQDTTTTMTIPAAVNADDNDKKSARCGLPMVITAYTLDECQEDQEVISQSITTSTAEDETRSSYRAKILWESERNPFGSQVIRETKSSTQEYRENACWQAWLFGGKTSS